MTKCLSYHIVKGGDAASRCEEEQFMFTWPGRAFHGHAHSETKAKGTAYTPQQYWCRSGWTLVQGQVFSWKDVAIDTQLRGVAFEAS